MKPVVLRTLNAIDWDFATPRSGYVAPPHWYPGTFIPALSDALVEALTPQGGTVFDPYGGIGTSGWSAIRLGRSCHIADINPVALLVAFATNSLLALSRADAQRTELALAALSRTIGRKDDLFGIDEPLANLSGIDGLIERICSPAPSELLAQIVVGPPKWELLQDWIAPETLSEIMRLMDAVTMSDSEYIQLLGLCMLSAIARSVSSQHASWGHIADNVRPKVMVSQNVHGAGTRWLNRARAFASSKTMPLIEAAIAPSPHIHLRDWSAPAPPGPGDADLLLTSPPYADAIDYTLAQRLSLYMLGYDDAAIARLVSGEIGARRKRFKSVSRSDWSKQLCKALQGQVTWLKPGGAVCLVLPHKDSGRSAGEDDLKTTLEMLGWKLVFEKDRSIHQSHTRQSWTSIKKETILAFAAN